MIALSCDNPVEQEKIFESLSINRSRKEFVLRSPLDLLLRERIGVWNIEPIPLAVIAVYNLPFCDLKIIAEIKKIPEFQWVPVLIFVKEKLRNLRMRFLEVGVTEVIEKPESHSQLILLIESFLKKYNGHKLMAG